MNVFLSLLILCIVNVSQIKTSPRKDNGGESSEGDRLIRKILSAGRFEELANKIADKAIWRLNHQNSSSISTFETHKNPEFKSTVDTIEVKPKKKGHKRHKNVIDVDAVLKKKVIPLVDLSFRYEHFTKGINTYTSSETKPPKKINDYNKDSSDENLDKHTIKENTNNKSKGRNVDEEKNILEKGENNESQEKAMLNEKIQTKTSSDISNFTREDETSTPKFQSIENQFGDEKTIVWDEKDESGDKHNSDKSVEDEIMTKEKKLDSSESNETHRNRATDDNVSTTLAYYDDNTLKDDIAFEKPSAVKELQLKEHEEIKKKRKHLLRREGDKTFAFEYSPDYAEYHDKLAEVRKVQNKNIY